MPHALVEERRYLGTLMMGDDLREEEVRMRVGIEQELHLRRRVGHRVRPAAQLEFGMPGLEDLPQLPRVLDDARPADVLVAAEDPREETCAPPPGRRSQAELHRVSW